MRAWELTEQQAIERRPLRQVIRPDPRPSPRQIRVRVRVCAICRTDLHVIEGDLESKRSPLIPGHQVVGIVDALGAEARRFRIGDRVGIAWLRSTCGRCADCARGDENLCRFSEYSGYHADGGYAELAVVDEAFAYAIPEVFSDADASPLLCAGIIGYRALERAALPLGGRLGLYGFGSSAHITLQVAKHRGAHVYVCTRGESHRALARGLGADWVGNAAAAPPDPLDSAILFAPAGALVPVALRALSPGGTLAIAGIHLSPIPEMTYEPHLFHEKRLTSVEANTRKDGEALLAIAAQIPIRPKVTLFSFDQANEALERLKQDGIDGTGVLEISGSHP